MRFEKRSDCYFDAETGLEWSLENYNEMPWQAAIDFCLNLGNGWRIPTIKELFTLVDHSKYNPATELPDMKPSYYWSSSTHAGYADYAWYVGFYAGYVYNYVKTFHGYVRCVRGGPLKYAI
jgi:hypothetical protein